MLLVSDASVLIDMRVGGLDALMFRLPHRYTTLDVVFQTELETDHPDYIALGLQIESAPPEIVEHAKSLKLECPALSIPDCMALALALRLGAVVLAADRRLVREAQNRGLEAHGTIWLVGELIAARHVDVAQARHAFDAMLDDGSFLPQADIEAMLASIELGE